MAEDGSEWVQSQVMHGVNDMVLLPTLTEEAISDNLDRRLKKGIIYTYIGNVLVSVNPFEQLPLYGSEWVQRYCGKMIYELPPHVYAIAEDSFRAMLMEEEPQCIIISGESGAGKTEAAKQIMSYIAAVSGGEGDVQRVKEIILGSNPLLEAFGNAKTLRNNNSSRFGKYFEIFFNRLGQPQGGKIEHFLLEKSRVVSQQKGERDFHIFYQLCSGSNIEMREKLGLLPASEFHFLAQSKMFTCDGVVESDSWAEMIASMEAVGLNKNARLAVFKLVAGLLFLGNISFGETASEAAFVEENGMAERAASLLGTDAEDLKVALITKTVEAAGESIRGSNNMDQSQKVRDALAKALYDKLFEWLINVVNDALEAAQSAITHTQDGGDRLYIGVLDIYGFEIFERNGFEQLCINYVNEQLQQIFIEQVLRAEQDEYAREGIQWSPIKFFNNRIVVDLIDSTKPPGIFSILNDVCATMHAVTDGADAKFIDKVKGAVGGHAHFSASTGQFCVKHYAGDVIYTATNFCDRNKDTLSMDVVAHLQNTRHKLVKLFFPPPEAGDEKRRPTTTAFKIKSQAQKLVKTLLECSPHYIRTVKSNETKSKKTFDRDRVLHQVKYLGLLENIKVRRAGFAFRQDFHTFNERYKYLGRGTLMWKGDDASRCKAILKEVSEALGLTKEQAQIGRSKLFLKQPQTLFQLEKLRSKKFSAFAKVIQRAYRSWSDRKALISTRLNVAKSFIGNKQRRAQSIFRPFSGQYLSAALVQKWETMQPLLKMGKREAVVFSEDSALVALPLDAPQILPAQQWQWYNIIPILTTDRIILFDQAPPLSPRSFSLQGCPPQTIPAMALRMIIRLEDITALQLSPGADDALVVKVRPAATVTYASVMEPDSASNNCRACGVRFSFFGKHRHHCRGCGLLFCHECSPESTRRFPTNRVHQLSRCCAKCLALQPSCIPQDFCFRSDRRTEFFAILQQSFSSRKQNIPELSFSSTCSIALFPAIGPDGSPAPVLPINISFGQPSKSSSAQTICISYSKGLTDEQVSLIRKSEAKRRRAAAARREEERTLRAEQALARSQQREAERKERVAASKARKAQEKAARAEIEQGVAVAQAKALAARRNVAQKAVAAEAPLSELQKRLLSRQTQ